MKEEQIRQEIQRLIRRSGFDDYHPPDMKATELGRPDIFGLNSINRGIVIEVKGIADKKRVEPSLNFNEISDQQRRWLDWWVWDRTGAGFLGLGTYFGSPRQLWIIPWNRWVDYEHWKYKETETYKCVISDLENYFKKFQAKWIGHELQWQLYENHPIAQIPTIYHDEDEWKEAHSFRFKKE